MKDGVLLRQVINVIDGNRYGYVHDVEVDLEEGRVKTLIIPGRRRWFGLFGREADVIIPWETVRRFGEDTILVDAVPLKVLEGEKRRGRQEKSLGNF